MMIRMLHNTSGRQNFGKVKEKNSNDSNQGSNANQTDLAKKTEAAIQEANKSSTQAPPAPNQEKGTC